eukprot:876030-Prymnesium_polylepis.1
MRAPNDRAAQRSHRGARSCSARHPRLRLNGSPSTRSCLTPTPNSVPAPRSAALATCTFAVQLPPPTGGRDAGVVSAKGSRSRLICCSPSNSTAVTSKSSAEPDSSHEGPVQPSRGGDTGGGAEGGLR